MLNTILTLGSTAFSVISGIKQSRKLEYFDSSLKQLDVKVQKISDSILYLPTVEEIRSLEINSNRIITNIDEVYSILNQIQNSLGGVILSSAMIQTPQKMMNALSVSPRSILLDIQPLNLLTLPANPDLVPILFKQGNQFFVGWQLEGALPLMMDCEFNPMPFNLNVKPYIKTKCNEEDIYFLEHYFLNDKCQYCGCSFTAVEHFNWKCDKTKFINANRIKNYSPTSIYPNEPVYYKYHLLINGKCKICGCSEGAIYHFGWYCHK